MRAAIAAGLALAGALVAADGAAASRIVYTCAEELCVTDPTGEHPRRLTHDGDRRATGYGAASLSYDGRTLAFSYGSRLYVADARARRRRLVPRGDRLTSSAGSPRLRRDGRALLWREALLGAPSVSYQVCRSRLRPLRARCGPQMDRAYHAWGRGGTILTTQEFDRRDLCVTTLAGRCTRVLAQTPALGQTFFQEAALSPDGRLLAVTEERTGGEGRVVLYDARTGRRVREVTRGHVDHKPTWSPDGRRIAFLRDQIVLAPEPNTQRVHGAIWTASVRGGRELKVVEGWELDDPSWGGGR